MTKSRNKIKSVMVSDAITRVPKPAKIKSCRLWLAIVLRIESKLLLGDGLFCVAIN